MNEISSLFSAFGGFLQNSAWYSMVKWPFWTLLFAVAAGGVYCARYGKKTLLSQGISSTLGILSLYLVMILACTCYPPVRSIIDLPFLALTDESATLMHPFNVAFKSVGPVTLKLMILVFLVNGADSFCGGGKGPIAWIMAEAPAMFIALFFYAAILKFINWCMPWFFGRIAGLLVFFILSVCVCVLLVKFFYTKCANTMPPGYIKFNSFLTTNRMGTLLSTSAMTFVFSTILMIILHYRGTNVVNYISVNRPGLVIVTLLVLTAQYIFEIFYQDRKVI